ncbi:hypothetical protein CV683_05900 [Borreliella burgdorferi]|nr:hypothetical protein CV691_06405 [Borreliella burgdorferi]PRQ97027.1 hypothetical protein CV674_06225 [Borreliella burgdorferi]PRQ97320.1 hypothetical protein CV679_05795 [Borreliella burgdorferi]PRR13280.1 hypothetical protein CV656_06605 [Borreliella burgdorferi]PRR14939.1 hypothetical protein CV649_05845 [Borreliella burgdorferi]
MKDFPSFYSFYSNKYKYIAKTIFANFFTKIFVKKKWDLTKLFSQRISLSPHYIIIFCKLL